MEPPKPKIEIPNFKGGDKVKAHSSHRKGETGIVVKVNKSRSSPLAKFRMLIKLDKPNKYVTGFGYTDPKDPDKRIISVVVNDWKIIGKKKK